MGIPSYFSYIIKNYNNIIRNLSYLKNNNTNFDHLYMDCNSIIYDSVYMLEKLIQSGELKLSQDFESLIIKTVIEKIYSYIDFIKPEKTLFIAFDGVAPFAKMKQQRTRRYKSSFLSEYSITKNNEQKWNTSSITPGTEFMEKLSKKINKEFLKKEYKLNIKQIIVSCSKEHGEGEHKIYQHIRNNNFVNDNIIVYGLDADLIMLSIFHLKYSKNIFVFRETPEFFKDLIHIENNSEPHFLNISQLCHCILSKMNCKFSNNNNRINDYVFLCFFLGNDFLPHFPAMNIRTHGIDVLLDIYRKYIGNYNDRYFISLNGNIQWNIVKIFIKEIANREHQFLINEYDVRKKFNKYKFLEKTDEEKNEIIVNTPIIYREKEDYICPYESHWENRYYFVLFNLDYNYNNIEKISNNYLEGLEWVYKYYTGNCPNWNWYYKYNYPPLFSDLYKFIPNYEKNYIFLNNNKISFEEQLCYVLPRKSLYLIPKEIEIKIKEKYLDLYPLRYNFEWSFCRYFWESHPILPEITLEKLKEITNI